MQIIEILIITTVLLIIAVLALSVRLIFTKKGEFRGGSCSTLNEQGVGCGCGGSNCETVN